MSGTAPERALSIVIVTHRRAGLLERCLASVAAATVPDDADGRMVGEHAQHAGEQIRNDRHVVVQEVHDLAARSCDGRVARRSRRRSVDG